MNKKHNMSRTPLYEVWKTMKQRCLNKKHKQYGDYGGRGIYVCEDWDKDYTSFHKWAMSNGYRSGACLDRVNNDCGYEPNNCRFTTNRTNGQNTRKSKIWFINGKRYNSLREASQGEGVHTNAIMYWCNKKEDCFSVPKYSK